MCRCVQVIPAENLVAAFQPGPGQLMGVAGSAADARVMLEALEAGTAGVLLRTEDPLQVHLDNRRRPAPALCRQHSISQQPPSRRPISMMHAQL